MPQSTTKIFLGEVPIDFYYIGNEQGGLNPTTAPLYEIRNDEFASFVKIAIPFNQFDNQFGMNNFYSDISSFIRNSGTNYPIIPTGSTVNGVSPIFQTTSSMVSSGSSFDWASNGYSTALYMSGSQNASGIISSSVSFGSSPFNFMKSAIGSCLSARIKT